MDFDSRYKKLNAKQKEAVDHIDGPLMVIAGPGTGKTELLSMRAANILRRTDTAAQNVLCLTFTEAGQTAMRKRLVEIMGQSGYQVAVHTFHGFAGDVMAQYRYHFFGGASFRIADDLVKYRVISSILDSLRYDNPLKVSMNGEYTGIKDILQAISEIKRSGLVLEELRGVLDANDIAIGAAERELAPVFEPRISAKTIPDLEGVIPKIEAIDEPKPLELIPRLSDTIIASLEQALAECDVLGGKTPPITAWKKSWLTKDSSGKTILKSHAQQAKLRELLPVYQQYCEILEKAQLYDYDDMIVQLIHVLETQDDVRFDLQERYQYIMVDEFQDTNLAQARILRNLTNNPIVEDQPNIMVVGDDDQAIYGFQGAEVGNIINFDHLYPRRELLTLTDNYRSTEPILSAAREVISQGSERLEARITELDKTLQAHATHTPLMPKLVELPTTAGERRWVTQQVAAALKAGTAPNQIAIIARKHADLEAMVPYLSEHDIAVSYEHQDNVLDIEVVRIVLLLAKTIHAIHDQRHHDAQALLPELLSHPAWDINAKTLWDISLSAYKERTNWIETILENAETSQLGEWLLSAAKASAHTPLETMLDVLLGQSTLEESEYTSPLKSYFFSDTKREQEILTYTRYLEALRTIRTKLREHNPEQTTLLLPALVEFVSLHAATNTSITSISHIGDASTSVQLLSAHGAKGLEFESVFILNAVDSVWGESVRSPSSLISYPENLRLRQHSGSVEERLRLFFVAMTRAKQSLVISYSTLSDTAKEQLRPSFLADQTTLDVEIPSIDTSAAATLESAQHMWYDPVASLPPGDMKRALAANLEKFQLTATSLGAFLDVTKGGPKAFLTEQLLHFPSAKSRHASFGSAIHATLQYMHTFVVQNGHLPPDEDILQHFQHTLDEQQLSKTDHDHFLHKGFDALNAFVKAKGGDFNANQLAEFDFSHQGAQLGQARLKGNLDVVELDKTAKTAQIIDYKTGSSLSGWGRGSVYDKIKSHHYRQQLLFYHILMNRSRDYANYQVSNLMVQFVEPNKAGEIIDLGLEVDNEELARLEQLVQVVWRHIMALDFPDTSQYEQSVEGIKAFEEDLLTE